MILISAIVVLKAWVKLPHSRICAGFFSCIPHFEAEKPGAQRLMRAGPGLAGFQPLLCPGPSPSAHVPGCARYVRWL